MCVRQLYKFAGLLLGVTLLGVPTKADNIVWNGSVNNSWQEPGNWTGGAVPGDGDVAYINWPDEVFVLLNADTAWIDGLHLSGGSLFGTHGYRLGVDDNLSAETLITGADTFFVVSPWAADPADRAFDTDLLTIVNQGSIYLSSGARMDVDVLAFIGQESDLTGRGVVRLGSASTPVDTPVLINDGTIYSDYNSDYGELYLIALGGGTLDLDGSSEQGIIDFDEYDLSLPAPRSQHLFVDGPLADDFSGTMRIGSADSVHFSQPWIAREALIHFYAHSGATATLSGGDLECYDTTILVEHHYEGETQTAEIEGDLSTVRGHLSVYDTLQLDGVVEIGAATHVYIDDADAKIDVNDSLTLYANVTFPATAELDLNDASELRIYGNTTINQPVIDLDSNGGMSVVVGPGGTLTLNVDSIDDDVPAGFNRSLDVVGTLNANVTGGWLADGDVELMGGSVTGTTLTNDGTITGHGSITSTGVVNNGTITASGGTLVIDSPGNTSDLDGTTDAGVLNALVGNLTLLEGDINTYNGEIHVGPGKKVSVEGGLGIRGTGPGYLYLNGGILETGDHFGLHGTMLVEGSPAKILSGHDLGIHVSNSTINANLDLHATEHVFLNTGSNVVLNAELRMISDNGSSNIRPGANISGSGTLVAVADDTLALLDGTEIGVHLRVDGTLDVGWSYMGQNQATVELKSLEQTSSGRLFMQFASTTEGEFDRLTVMETAELDGEFIFRRRPITGIPYEVYDPQIGDSWTLVKAGSVVGEFTTFTYDWYVFPVGSYVHLVYQPTRVIVEVLPSFTADFDHDGDVDNDDLTVWQDSFHYRDDGDANGDGISDGADFLIWQRQFGSSVIPHASSVVPEPHVLVLLLSVCLSTLVAPRRSR